MRIITRTVYGGALQTALYLNLAFQPELKTTLNEKFDIMPNTALEPNQIPPVKYFCIGNGGHKVVAGADGIGYTSPISHRATDAALFNHIPFVLRELDNDLSITQREKYALRKIITVNGIDYIAYYLKRMDVSSSVLGLTQTKVVDGTSTVTEFVPTNDNLNPTPPAVPNDGTITTDGSYVAASSIITVVFDEVDVAELVNVSRILYNTDEKAVISEIGLCSGVDKINTATGIDGSFNYTEAIATQIVTHITGYYPVGFTNKGFNIQIEAGATEPMLGENIN